MKYNTLLTVFFLGTRPGRTVGPIFTPYDSNGVFPRKEVPFGVRTINDVTWAKDAPYPLKVGINRQFQAKMLKIALSLKLKIRSSRNLRIKQRPPLALRGWATIALNQIQHGWRPPSWKSLWRHAHGPIPMKFGVPVQNHMPMTAKKSKSKPEVELQNGPSCFYKLEVVISRPPLVEVWYANSLDLLKCETWPKPETGSRFATLWPPWCNINMTSWLRWHSSVIIDPFL